MCVVCVVWKGSTFQLLVSLLTFSQVHDMAEKAAVADKRLGNKLGSSYTAPKKRQTSGKYTGGPEETTSASSTSFFDLSTGFISNVRSRDFLPPWENVNIGERGKQNIFSHSSPPPHTSDISECV